MSSKDQLEFNWQATKKTTKEKHEFLLNNQIMSDVTFVFTEKDNKKQNFIYAHSWILSASSSVFYRSFKGNFEVSKQIPIEEISAEIFLEFLKHLYLDQCEITDKNVIQILSLSQKYVIPYLEEICNEFIEKDLNINSVCGVLEKALQLDCKNVIKSCLDFISPRSHLILQSESFLKIHRKTLSAILNMNKLTLSSEFEIFTFVMLWADAECVRRNMTVNGKSKRKILNDDIIKLIRFPTMTIEEFLKCVAVEDLLTSQEISSILLTFSIKKPNQFGFNINKRFIDLSELPLVKVDLTNRMNSCAQSDVDTLFSVNKPIFLIGVELQNVELYDSFYDMYKSIQYTYQLFNDKNELLIEEKTNNNIIKFVNPVCLVKDCTYKISNKNNSGQYSNFDQLPPIRNSYAFTKIDLKSYLFTKDDLKSYVFTKDDLIITFNKINSNLKCINIKHL